jgi:hypothetical protein
MDENKKIEQQENLFFEKLAEFEKEYIKNIYKDNRNNNILLADKQKKIQELILDLIKFQKAKSSFNNFELNELNERELNFKNLFKRIKNLVKEEGGFLFMPFRMIFYNFLVNYKNNNNRKSKNIKTFPKENNLLETSIIFLLINFFFFFKYFF